MTATAFARARRSPSMVALRPLSKRRKTSPNTIASGNGSSSVPASVRRTRNGSRRTRAASVLIGAPEAGSPRRARCAASGVERSVEFGAQQPHVGLDHVRALLIGDIPRLFEQPLLRRDVARAAGERLQQVKLAGRQAELDAVADGGSRGGIDLQRSDTDGLPPAALVATHLSADPRDEF